MIRAWVEKIIEQYLERHASLRAQIQIAEMKPGRKYIIFVSDDDTMQALGAELKKIVSGDIGPTVAVVSTKRASFVELLPPD